MVERVIVLDVRVVAREGGILAAGGAPAAELAVAPPPRSRRARAAGMSRRPPLAPPPCEDQQRSPGRWSMVQPSCSYISGISLHEKPHGSYLENAASEDVQIQAKPVLAVTKVLRCSAVLRVSEDDMLPGYAMETLPEEDIIS